MARTTTQPRTARGMTLLESVIALAILMSGIVGMLQLQIFGVTADEGGRVHTQALEAGRELLAALERLPVDDAAHLNPNFTDATAPAGFGRLLVGTDTLATSPFYSWTDGSLPGVTSDAAYVAAGQIDPVKGGPRFQRRWTVWMPPTPLTLNSSKLIAVSVTYRERGLSTLREVVLYGTVINAGAVTAFAGIAR